MKKNINLLSFLMAGGNGAELVSAKFRLNDGTMVEVTPPATGAPAPVLSSSVSAKEEEEFPERDEGEEPDYDAYAASMGYGEEPEPATPVAPAEYKVKMYLRKGLSVLAERPNGTGDWSVIATDEGKDKRYNVVIPKSVVETVPNWNKLVKDTNTANCDTWFACTCVLDTESGRNIVVVKEML